MGKINTQYTNSQIQKKADALLYGQLSEMFNDSGLELLPHDQNNQEDRGIDWVYELVDKKDRKSVLRFNVQNKGSYDIKSFRPLSKPNHPKKGLISWQLKKVRQANYFYNEVVEPLIVCICDLNNSIIYWNPIQLDAAIESEIGRRIEAGEKSIQIYFNPRNEISSGNLPRLIKDIKSSIVEQKLKFEKREWSSFDLVLSSYTNDNNRFHVLVQIERSFSLFDGLLVIPPHLFLNLYPFSKSIESRNRYSEFNLYLDNEKLFNFFDNLILVKGKIQLKVEDKQLVRFRDWSERVEKVVKVLGHNLVHHLYLSGTQRRVCIHLLQDVGECECVRCLFGRLDFTKSFALLNSEVIVIDDYDQLKRINVLYQFGFFERSIDLYFDVLKKCKNEGRYLLYFVTIYNLKKLEIFVKRKVFGESRSYLLTRLGELDLEDDLNRIKTKLGPELYQVASWIKEDKFIDKAMWKISSLHQEIIEIYDRDQSGGWTTKDKESALLNELAKIATFIGGNFIVYDNFSEFQVIAHKSLEAFVALHSLGSPHSMRIKSIRSYVLRLLVFYGDYESIRRIFKKYNVGQILSEPGNDCRPNMVLVEVDNYFSSMDSIMQIINFDNEDPNYYFRDKVSQIFDNICIVCGALEMPYEKVNNILEQILLHLPFERRLFNNGWKSLNSFIRYKKSQISKSLLYKILLIAVTDSSFDAKSVVKNIADIFSKRFGRLSLSQSRKLLGILCGDVPHLSDMKVLDSIFDVIDLCSVLSVEIVEEVRIEVNRRLGERFNSELYYDAVVCDVINYKDMFDVYFDSIPKEINYPRQFDLFGGRKIRRSNDLNQFINLAFYVGEELSNQKYQDLGDGVLYYQWLLDLDRFNYENFNPFWILEYFTIPYKEQFRSCLPLKVKLEEYLLDKKSKGVFSAYLEIYKEEM